ncbi:hypothetical protein BLNAU_17718 [Blattamonas nauphoetae]|uniref:Uncharacterized protein n=1 Tax=Blattamonas nauphoetae TaxID=2049346 RepID=A0ABQ9X6C5_9EUKA|nr:hypothetical protein BLNAU_17718 [Blattamonas nauphoetae]
METETHHQLMTTENNSTNLSDMQKNVKPEHSMFLNIEQESTSSFEKKSSLFNSLVAVVKDEIPISVELEEHARRFLQNLSPRRSRDTSRLLSDLVPSPDGSPSGLMSAIATLLRSKSSLIIEGTLSFVAAFVTKLSYSSQSSLLDALLIPKMIDSLQPHTLPISSNEQIHSTFVQILSHTFYLTTANAMDQIGIVDAPGKHSHRNMILEKVIHPTSGYLAHLIRNVPNDGDGDLGPNLMSFLGNYLRLGWQHAPTLEYLLSQSIEDQSMALLVSSEINEELWSFLFSFRSDLRGADSEGNEATRTRQRMKHALFSVGFEEWIEAEIHHTTDGDYAERIGTTTMGFSDLFGSNIDESE